MTHSNFTIHSFISNDKYLATMSYNYKLDFLFYSSKQSPRKLCCNANWPPYGVPDMGPPTSRRSKWSYNWIHHQRHCRRNWWNVSTHLTHQYTQSFFTQTLLHFCLCHCCSNSSWPWTF